MLSRLQAGAEAFGMPSICFYCSKGLMTKVGAVDELAEITSTRLDTLQGTLSAYDAHAASTAELHRDDFGKMLFPAPLDTGDDQVLYVAQVTPAVHYCMGGIKFTPSGEVIGKDGNVLPGMFAAGEVTGGLHGRNRLAGSSLLECVVFGRRAGVSAAQFLTAF